MVQQGSLIQVRVDESVKNKADALFADLGFDTPTAIRIFLNQAIRREGMPFELAKPQPSAETMAAILNGMERMPKQYNNFKKILAEVDAKTRWKKPVKYKIEQSLRFRRDLKTAIKRGYNMDMLDTIVELLVEAFGFRLDRINGSHHIYIHKFGKHMISIQNDGKNAKPYQVKQFLTIIEQHCIKMEDD